MEFLQGSQGAIKLIITYVFSANVKGEMRIGVVKKKGVFSFYKHSLFLDASFLDKSRVESKITQYINENFLKKNNAFSNLSIRVTRAEKQIYVVTVIIEIPKPNVVKLRRFKMFSFKKLIQKNITTEVQQYVKPFLALK